VTNIDRTSRNANMLVWHRRLWLIDHGAALYFHHTWKDYLSRSQDRFPQSKTTFCCVLPARWKRQI
jgi:hypothetical protein